MQSTIRYWSEAPPTSGGSGDALITGFFKKRKKKVPCIFGPCENIDDPPSPSLILLHECPTLLEQTNTALYLRLLETHRSQSACGAVHFRCAALVCPAFPPLQAGCISDSYTTFLLQAMNSVFSGYDVTIRLLDLVPLSSWCLAV